jgi:long-chain acyl-CoA synthetase
MMTLTPLECFLKWEKETPESPFLRQPHKGEWHVYSYRQAGEEIRKVAAALKKFRGEEQTHVAILSKNCAHWLMADLAIMMAGMVSVPVYPTLSAAGIKQLVEHSRASIIFVGKLDNYEEQKSAIPVGLVKFTFPLYGIEEGLKWNDIIKEPLNVGSVPHKPDSVATIMYSSGTTGTPKGVMLTHNAFGYVGEHVKNHLKIKKPERFFSYLPLSHIAERALMEMVALSSGSTISFAESLDTFTANLQHERPTIFGGVPRIYAKFQDGILKKLPQEKLNKLLAIPLVSTLIKKRIKDKLGLSQARVIVSGAAPTPVNLLEWFKKMGIEIRELYGMTENTALSHGNLEKIKIGTVGQPWPGVEAKLSEEGEVLVRHQALMTEYFLDPETTRQVFTTDGFLRTGDMGTIDSEGFLTITGRVKDQFKTDKAKFIAPAPIEMKLLANPDIDQVCVVGLGLPQPIALVVPSATGLSKSPQVLEQSVADIVKKVNTDLEEYEKLQKAVIVKETWTLENGFLTPSLKLKRNEIERVYGSKYAHWYKDKAPVIRA